MKHLPPGLCSLLLVAAGCRAPAAPAAGPWWPVAAPTTASLRGLAVVDADVVWVGGTGGTLLRTVDGGASWQDVRPADALGCDFRDVHAFSADVAVAMVAGQPARVYRTEDGGSHWTVVHADPRLAAFFDAIAFAGEDGVLFGDPVDGAFSVWWTHDAGRSWRALPAAQLPPPLVEEAAFAASGTCATVVAHVGAAPHALVVTGGAVARCLRLSLGGEAPRAAALPVPYGAPSRGAFSIAVHGDRAVVVGGDYRRPDDAVTAACGDANGDGWRAAAIGGYRSAVAWLDDTCLLAVGSHGASVSIDGGRSWQPFGYRGFHGVAVGSDGSIWACGDDGSVARLDRRALPAPRPRNSQHSGAAPANGPG